MSVPFSNTHLRVPRGFGTVLEGLAREVLRDQPEDIPAFAAQYFEQLLKQREESGTDPAEWTARLEDRFYNNHAFNTTETVSHEKEAAEEETGSKEKTYESQTEDELSQSEEEPTLSNEQPPISDQTELAEGTDQENNDPTEQSTILLESRNTEKRSEKQPDEQSSTEKAKDFTKDRHDQFNRLGNEVNISPVPDSATQEFVLDMSNLLPSKETSNVDLGSQDEVSSKCEREDQQDDTFIDCENASVEKEEHTEVTEPLESLQYFALVNADVCASELGGTKPFEDGVFQEHTYSAEEGETFNSQLEENAVELPPSQYETPQDKQQEPEDQAQKQHERETTATEACNEETNKTLSHSQNSLDNNVIPKKDSLDEISYNDIPEDQCITEVSEEKTAKDDSTEVLLTYISDKNQNDEFKELGKSLTDNVSIEDTHETEMEIIKTDVPLEKEELQSHHTAFDILKDKGETNELNCSDDCERETDGKNTKIENENKDQETDYKQEHKEEISDDKPDLSSESKVKVQANEQDSKEDETTDEVCTQQEINNSKAIQNPSQLITSDISMTGVLRDNETSEENHEHQSGQNPQSYRIIGNSQSEDLKEEKQNMFKEHEEIGISEVQEEGEELGKEETITPTGSADWTAADHREEERPAVLEENNIASANMREKEECSRPQEEEDIMDIPLDDPEANRAAAKIQAGFRGHMTRKKMKPEDKTEGEEVSSTGDVLNNSQGGSEAGRSGAVERHDTSVPEQ